MSIFWSSWITIISLACWFFIIGVLLYVLRTKPELEEDGTTGHVYDDVIQEYDKPLPKWWLVIFVGSIIWAVVYWVLWPALMPGVWAGIATEEVDGKTVPWTSSNELASDLESNSAQFTTNFQTNFLPDANANEHLATLTALQKEKRLADEPRGTIDDEIDEHIQALAPYVSEISNSPEAFKAGQRLFLQNCSVCHGANARGAQGYPNLTDDDWLYGGEPADILTSLQYGRIGGMPAWREQIGEDGVRATAEYVLALSGNQNGYELDTTKVAQGKAIFNQQCVICHGQDGTGMTSAGAPNLTDNIWLYGGDRETIRETLRHGRAGVMPTWSTKLSNERIMLLASYVYSLSNNQMQSQPSTVVATESAAASH